MSLEGRVAIVTGAAQGIGRAIAETLAHAGADIVVADLDPARSADAVAAVEKAGRKALNIKVNVADANDTKAMADQVSKEWGKIDILVNNAGITRDGLLLRMKEEDWNLVLQVNLNGTFHCTKESCSP
jgi:3-oxoacyl-[acyl-carrier protein] reductase